MPSLQLLGVYDEYLVEPLAQVLSNLGIKRGMVVYGQDKLDEISLSAPTTVCEIRDGWLKSSVITPEDFGFARCAKEDLKGGPPRRTPPSPGPFWAERRDINAAPCCSTPEQPCTSAARPIA